jgi:ubiquinone/menaquinone biosynthesis C-methylase UbiE
LRRLGLRDGMEVLELGCGPGFVTERLCAGWPASAVTAVDLDPEMLRRARASVPSDGRARFVVADAMATGLPAQHYDFAIARYLFQHLRDPVAAAREALRILKPDGTLAVIDVDAALWGIADPVFPEVQAIYAKTGRAQAARGGDRLVGRKLWRILKAAGFTQLELDAFVYHSDALGLAPFASQLDPDRLLPFVRDGSITEEELSLVRDAHHRFLAAPDPYLLMVGLLASGKRPAA